MSKAGPPEEANIGAKHFCEIISPFLESRSSVLVAGCGTGREALLIHEYLEVPVSGVDLNARWTSEGSWNDDVDGLELQQGSVLDLPFEDNSFDIVFYHHVMEHVSDPPRSLKELARVLAPGGIIYIGTPNRHRILGYLGSPEITLRTKLHWNLVDYKARLRGKFRNECGAHAGFSEKELRELLSVNFTDVRSLTSGYLNYKYENRFPNTVLKLISSRLLSGVAAASVYAIARKPPAVS